MTVEQVLWGGLTLLFALLFFAVKTWIANVKTLLEKSDVKLESKVSANQCLERYTNMKHDLDDLRKHKHAETGEVILP